MSVLLGLLSSHSVGVDWRYSLTPCFSHSAAIHSIEEQHVEAPGVCTFYPRLKYVTCQPWLSEFSDHNSSQWWWYGIPTLWWGLWAPDAVCLASLQAWHSVGHVIGLSVFPAPFLSCFLTCWKPQVSYPASVLIFSFTLLPWLLLGPDAHFFVQNAEETAVALANPTAPQWVLVQFMAESFSHWLGLHLSLSVLQLLIWITSSRSPRYHHGNAEQWSSVPRISLPPLDPCHIDMLGILSHQWHWC